MHAKSSTDSDSDSRRSRIVDTIVSVLRIVAIQVASCEEPLGWAVVSMLVAEMIEDLVSWVLASPTDSVRGTGFRV